MRQLRPLSATAGTQTRRQIKLLCSPELSTAGGQSEMSAVLQWRPGAATERQFGFCYTLWGRCARVILDRRRVPSGSLPLVSTNEDQNRWERVCLVCQKACLMRVLEYNSEREKIFVFLVVHWAYTNRFLYFLYDKIFFKDYFLLTQQHFFSSENELDIKKLW